MSPLHNRITKRVTARTVAEPEVGVRPWFQLWKSSTGAPSARCVTRVLFAGERTDLRSDYAPTGSWAERSVDGKRANRGFEPPGGPEVRFWEGWGHRLLRDQSRETPFHRRASACYQPDWGRNGSGLHGSDLPEGRFGQVYESLVGRAAIARNPQGADSASRSRNPPQPPISGLLESAPESKHSPSASCTFRSGIDKRCDTCYGNHC